MDAYRRGSSGFDLEGLTVEEAVKKRKRKVEWSSLSPRSLGSIFHIEDIRAEAF